MAEIQKFYYMIIIIRKIACVIKRDLNVFGPFKGHLTSEVKLPKMVPPEGAKGSFDLRGHLTREGAKGSFDPGGEMA